jgi:hypothetical protein
MTINQPINQSTINQPISEDSKMKMKQANNHQAPCIPTTRPNATTRNTRSIISSDIQMKMHHLHPHPQYGTSTKVTKGDTKRIRQGLV